MEAIQNIIQTVARMKWSDYLDIIIVAYLLYRILPLIRTTGAEGVVEDLTTQQLEDYKLEGTEETIPTFRQVLDLFDGKAPIIVELKPENGNHAALTEAACKMLETYKGVYCLESFDPRCLSWLKKNRPNLIRGILSENYFKVRNDFPDVLRFVLTHLLTNVATFPDFVAYRFSHRKDSVSNWLCQKLWGTQGVSWTLTSREEYDTAVAEGLLPIFEGFRP